MDSTGLDTPPLVHRFPSAARRINVSRTTFFAMVKAGELPTIRVGGIRMVTERAIVEYVAKLEAQAGK